MIRRTFISRALGVVSASAFLPLKGLSNIWQNQKKDTIITLIVNTSGITRDNVDEMVRMTDNRGGRSEKGNNKNFVSSVDIGKKVFWDGGPEDMSTGDQVLIRRIEIKPGAEGISVLKKTKYTGNAQVFANVKKKFVEGEMNYNVEFELLRNGAPAGTFVLDPKLKINP